MKKNFVINMMALTLFVFNLDAMNKQKHQGWQQGAPRAQRLQYALELIACASGPPGCVSPETLRVYGYEILYEWFEADESLLHTTDNEGNTFVHLEVKKGNLYEVGRFLEKGVDGTKLNKDGKSPLAIAREKGNQKIIGLLERYISWRSKKRVGKETKSTAKCNY